MTVAIIAGGYSSEFDISIASGKTAEAAFIQAGYKTLWLTLTKEGLFTRDGASVQLEALRSNHDVGFVFNSIHGTPGENGLLSGNLELIGLPHSTCAALESALTFDKGLCNELLRARGFDVPRGALFTSLPDEHTFDHWKFPLFVKPNASGSSYGVSRVEDKSGLAAAFDYALTEGGSVLVEEAVVGTEVGCGVFATRFNFSTQTLESNPVPQAVAITEIVPTESSFFDFDAKYAGKSQEITPARIPDEQYRAITSLSERIYASLRLKGLVRIDFIIEPSGRPVLIEINSIPGLSPASIVPKQLAYRQWPLSDVLHQMVLDATASHN